MTDHKVDWVIILFLILFIQIIVYQDPLFGMFLGVMIIFVVYLRQNNFKTKMIGFLLMTISLVISVFNQATIIGIFNKIDALLGFSIYDATIDFIKINQSNKAADFILLTLFNIKQNEAIFFLLF